MNLKTSKLKKLFKSKLFYFGLLFLIFGSILNQVSSIYIYHNFQDLPVLRDSVLEFIPIFKISWAFDILSVASVLLFIFYAYTKEFEKIPYFLLVFGILQLLRGIFIVLTPLANPDLEIYNGFLQSSELIRRGMFPSGHTGLAFLAFLFAKKPYRIFFLATALALIIFLLLAHGHYSIDIFSAILFAYAIYAYGEKHLKETFTLK